MEVTDEISTRQTYRCYHVLCGMANIFIRLTMFTSVMANHIIHENRGFEAHKDALFIASFVIIGVDLLLMALSVLPHLLASKKPVVAPVLIMCLLSLCVVLTLIGTLLLGLHIALRTRHGQDAANWVAVILGVIAAPLAVTMVVLIFCFPADIDEPDFRGLNKMPIGVETQNTSQSAENYRELMNKPASGNDTETVTEEPYSSSKRHAKSKSSRNEATDSKKEKKDDSKVPRGFVKLTTGSESCSKD